MVSEGAKSDGARYQPLGEIGLTKDCRRDWKHGKSNDEQRHSAIGHCGARQHNRQYGTFATKLSDRRIGQNLGASGIFHQLTEDGAKQEDREVLNDKISHRNHEDLGVTGKQWPFERGEHHEYG